MLLECESIISSTENIEELVAGDYLDNQEFFIIRHNAEKIEEMIAGNYDIDDDEPLLSDEIEEIEELRIEIYQAAKYISEDYLENKNDDYNNLDELEKEVVNEFKYIQNSTDNISNLLTN